MSAPGGTIEPEHLSADLTAPERTPGGTADAPRVPLTDLTPGNLASAVETVERHLIATTLDRTRGNISESARVLGLTRRGLYLKMRRLGLEGAIADI
jgi:DNA-binding NtrC family response regulator